MSTSPFAADPSTGRLLDEGYQLIFAGNHLIVEHVPYLNSDGEVRYGQLALPVVISGTQVQDGSGDHRIWFVGEQPYDAAGQPLPGPSPEHHAITEDLIAGFMISSKPRGTGSFPDMHAKVTSHVRVLGHPAEQIDPSVTAKLGASISYLADELPFVYADTGTSRAGLAQMNAVFRGHRIAIIGLGGTGSYILDQVSKTWVDAIHLFDGDGFDNHNAFRAPGAAALAELQTRPNKSEYFAAQYGRMHTGIFAHPEHVNAFNMSALSDMTFVFMAAADADEKPAILGYLAERGIPVIEVGMGIQDEGGHLSGLLAVNLHLPGTATGSLEASAAPAANEYDRNIQVADLNSLNAMMAVIAWKKHLGYYASSEAVIESVYKIFTGDIRNGAAPAAPGMEDAA